MSEQLLSCPFCGYAKPTFAIHQKNVFVYCPQCKASSNVAQRKEDAVYLWNKRAESKTGRWVGDCCSVCGVSKYNYIKMASDGCAPFGTWKYCPNCGSQMQGE